MDRDAYNSRLRPFFGKFMDESDRACAMLAVALLDSRLEELLLKAMIPDVPRLLFEYPGPLSTFSAKVDMSFALGLISSDERDELNLVRRIRNAFAHELDHELSFATPSVADRTQALSLPRFVLDFQHLSPGSLSEKEIEEFTNIPRKRFELSIGCLLSRLYERTEATKAPTNQKV